MLMLMSTLCGWCRRAGGTGCATRRRLATRGGTVLCYRQRGTGDE
jgi:hypothetical protein